MRSIQKKFEAIEKQRDSALNALGEGIRTTLVLPACRKYKLEFVSGMGTWFFVTIDPDPLTKGTQTKLEKKKLSERKKVTKAISHAAWMIRSASRGVSVLENALKVLEEAAPYMEPSETEVLEGFRDLLLRYEALKKLLP
jgi:hypothetical protein